jgi:hypothetical protein
MELLPDTRNVGSKRAISQRFGIKGKPINGTIEIAYGNH